MCCSVAGCSSSPGGRCIMMIEDGHNFGLMLALRHLLGRLESKGMMSYPETQRMLDQALADVKRLRIEDKCSRGRGRRSQNHRRIVSSGLSRAARSTAPRKFARFGGASRSLRLAPIVSWREGSSALRRQLSYHLDDQEQNDRADGRREDGADQAAAKRKADAESRKQHARHQRADNADENVAQEAKASSLHQKSGEPAGDGTNDQRYKQSCQH